MLRLRAARPADLRTHGRLDVIVYTLLNASNLIDSLDRPHARVGGLHGCPSCKSNRRVFE
jgi:hypothetical protein